MAKDTSPSRLSSIDLCRAYAILGVTYYHIWRYFGSHSFKLAGLPGLDLNQFWHRGRWGVELFFIISGYCMAMTTSAKIQSGAISWKDYLLKRLYRVAPAYYVSMAIWTFLIYRGVAVKPVGLVHQLTHLTFMHSFFPGTYFSISGLYWSISVEMSFYLILPLIAGLLIRYPWVCLAISLGMFFGGNVDPRNFLINKTIFHFLAYFVIGYIVFVKKGDLEKSGLASSMMAIAGVVAHILLSTLEARYSHLWQLAWSVSLVPLLLWTEARDDRLTATVPRRLVLGSLAWIGRISYSVYLYNYVFYIDVRPFAHTYFAVAYYFCMVIAFGAAMYYLVEVPFEEARQAYFRSRAGGIKQAVPIAETVTQRPIENPVGT